MHVQIKKLVLIQSKIKEILVERQLKITSPEIIAVTKTFSLEYILPLIQSGHIHFGENKVQEAENKWPKIKIKFSNIQLHMIGKLQANKAKKAVKLFDFIHSLDNYRLAEKINRFENELNKKTKLFIQVNTGQEDQKSGILAKDLNDFYEYCNQKLSLNVIGLMCLPPENDNANEHFKLLKECSKKLNLKDLSMGMSHDYPNAIINGATYIRLGTSIFGKRKN